MWLNNITAKKFAVGIAVVFAFLIFILVNKQLTIKKLKVEIQTVSDQLAVTRSSIEHPATVKEGNIQIKTVTRVVNLTEQQKIEIAQNFQLEIQELERIIAGLQEYTTTIIKDGKEIRIPVIPNNPDQPQQQLKTGLATVGLFQDSFNLGINFKLKQNWNWYTGIEWSQDFKGNGNLGAKVGFGF